MCGFTGILHRSASLNAETLTGTLKRMTETLTHRGPDDGGFWLDLDRGLALGHRRLSVIDLSASGHQPMLSHNGRYVMVFNGEIYNHLDLRQALEAGSTLPWRGHSDTETLLAGIAHWGLRETLDRAVGMFAFALYDRETQTLHLVRDRLGEKPLYYGWQNDVFLFGSELKALKTHPAFQAEIDRDALTQMLRYGYLPAPHTIYRGIHKLLPGSWLAIKLADDYRENLQSYWSARQVAETGQTHPFTGSPDAAITQLDTLLHQAVRGQMAADVPLGAFLSGGYDSSAIVALMQAQSLQPIKTFTIGFQEEAYDEAGHAAAIAKHLGTEHTTLQVTPRETLEIIPRLPALYDEPFADPSQIPTFLVSQLTRQHVTVSLSGDGGDELFGGYHRYFRARSLWAAISPLPVPVRTALARVLRGLPADRWTHLLDGIQQAIPECRRRTGLGDKIHKLATLLTAQTPTALYRDMNSHWLNPAEIVLNAREPPSPWPLAHLQTFEQQMMYQDLLTYLPDDILVKVDRAAMGVSLETRIPFLDHRVVEFAWQLPLPLKMREGQGKWLLRQLVHRYLPPALVERPKMGFGIPLETWLRGPLRDWAEALLTEARLRREGYFDADPIRKLWQAHLTGQGNGSYPLWNILMFQAWLEAQ